MPTFFAWFLLVNVPMVWAQYAVYRALRQVEEQHPEALRILPSGRIDWWIFGLASCFCFAIRGSEVPLPKRTLGVFRFFCVNYVLSITSIVGYGLTH